MFYACLQMGPAICSQGRHGEYLLRPGLESVL